jgi:predicted transcriptional regulator YdeE
MQFDRKVAGRLLSDPETYGSVLLTLALSVVGDELFETDPLEIYARLEETFNQRIPEQGENRLNAIMLAVSTDAFYESLEGFVSVAATLSDGDLGDLISGAFDEITIPECLWAIFEVELMRDSNTPEFAQSIIQYLAQEFEEDGSELPNIDGLREDYLEFMEESKTELLQQFRDLGIADELLQQL